MKKSKEELTHIHKAKCRELKEIRAKIAENLGLLLHQRECTYEGYCRGTCPACRKEEIQLNEALRKKQMEGVNLKERAAAAGLAAMTALCLTGCTPPESNMTEDTPEISDADLAGFITPETAECNPLPSDGYIILLEGEAPQEISEIPAQPSYDPHEESVELEGDIAYQPTEEDMTYIQETEEPMKAD